MSIRLFLFALVVSKASLAQAPSAKMKIAVDWLVTSYKDNANKWILEARPNGIVLTHSTVVNHCDDMNLASADSPRNCWNENETSRIVVRFSSESKKKLAKMAKGAAAKAQRLRQKIEARCSNDLTWNKYGTGCSEQGMKQLIAQMKNIEIEAIELAGFTRTTPSGLHYSIVSSHTDEMSKRMLAELDESISIIGD
jgi:hypothetical protein